MGWCGLMREMLYVLNTCNAEKDTDGKFMIWGEQPATFLGLDGPNAELVVSEKVLCRIKGQFVSVASLMNSTSCGIRNVRVI